MTPRFEERVGNDPEGETTAAKPGIPAAEIRAVLQDVLQSEAFSNSKRCCDFLSHVVGQTLAGLQHELKERTIAVAVFGRNASYDSHEDAIVRIKASEVRKRLGHYYAEAGKNAAVRISLPTGGYVPVFSGGAASRSGERAASAAAIEPVAPPLTRKFAWAGLVLILVLATAASLAWFRPWSKPSFQAQFWSPALQAHVPVYLLTAAAPVYVAYDTGEVGAAKSGNEYILVADQYVGQGDMLAAHLIATMLRNLGQNSEVKVSSRMDLRDLSQHPVVMIGYSSTQWEAISKDFRFFIEDEKTGMVTDRGKDTDWYPHHLTKDLHTDEDYAVVSRFFDPATHAMVVLVSGSTQYGTEGAAELVTNGDLLRGALRDRPPDWEMKNLQLVLHMKVIGNSPATPSVVASYYW